MSKEKENSNDSAILNAKDFIEMQGEVVELMPAATITSIAKSRVLDLWN